MARRKRGRPRGFVDDPGRGKADAGSRPGAPRDASLEAHQRIEVAALLARFPELDRRTLGLRVATIVALSLLSLYGLIAWNWDAPALYAWVGVELASVIVLNAVANAVLPVPLTEQDLRIIRGWKWLGAWLVAGLGLFLVVEGRAGADRIVASLEAAAAAALEFVRARRMEGALAALAIILLGDFLGDIWRWRARGGAFRYFSGIAVLFRVFFLMLVGPVLLVFTAGSPPVLLVWLVMLGAELFALGMPQALHREWRRREGRAFDAGAS